MRSRCNSLRSRPRKIGVRKSTTFPPLLLKLNLVDHKGSSFFCLDIGSCSKLRSITLEAALTETSTIDSLVILLSTLRNPPNLSRIRVLATSPPSYDSESHSLSQLETWRQLDDLLCELCPSQTGKEDDVGLTFQIASRKSAVPLVRSSRLLELLPNFSQVGTCEEVEV